jgi:hypothetical protein
MPVGYCVTQLGGYESNVLEDVALAMKRLCAIFMNRLSCDPGAAGSNPNAVAAVPGGNRSRFRFVEAFREYRRVQFFSADESCRRANIETALRH